ncbi:MAG TPA: hypothetical protein VFJ58_09745 [Armatimonadota bacterium]|nr:hypothetical protein [Armatimonadota bacterium]
MLAFSAILVLGCAMAAWAGESCPVAYPAWQALGEYCYYSGTTPVCSSPGWYSGYCEDVYGQTLACETFTQYYTLKWYTPIDKNSCVDGCKEEDIPNQYFTNARNGPDACYMGG